MLVDNPTVISAGNSTVIKASVSSDSLVLLSPRKIDAGRVRTAAAEAKREGNFFYSVCSGICWRLSSYVLPPRPKRDGMTFFSAGTKMKKDRAAAAAAAKVIAMAGSKQTRTEFPSRLPLLPQCSSPVQWKSKREIRQ